MRNLSNVSLREMRALLTLLGLKVIRTKGGHEAWRKAGMARSVIIQTHVEPVPEFVVKNAIRNLCMTRKDFIALLESL